MSEFQGLIDSARKQLETIETETLALRALHLQQAKDLYQKAIEAAGNDLENQAIALIGLGDIEVLEKSFTKAKELYNQAIEKIKQSSNKEEFISEIEAKVLSLQASQTTLLNTQVNPISEIIIKPDGDCMFRAILSTINTKLASDEEVQKLRAQVASVLLAEDRYKEHIKEQIKEDIKKAISMKEILLGYAGEFLEELTRIMLEVYELPAEERDNRLDGLISEECIGRYIEGIGNGNIWGGGIELTIIEQLLGIEIEIHEIGKESYKVGGNSRIVDKEAGPAEKKLVKIWYNGRDHYDVYKEQDKQRVNANLESTQRIMQRREGKTASTKRAANSIDTLDIANTVDSSIDDILKELSTLDLRKAEDSKQQIDLEENIPKIKEYLKEQTYSEASKLIKVSLKWCHNIFNQGKYLKEEYELFMSLAEIYANKGDLRDYPKAAAIYEYLKVLVTKLDPSIEAMLTQEVQEKIEQLEERFVRLHTSTTADKYNVRASLARIEEYKEKLQLFREGIKEDLKRIENLGIPDDKTVELDEDGLFIRAQKMEKIYKKIQNYFIREQGLFKKLIAESIEELGDLPEVEKKDGSRAKLEYAFFGMGSMALCTMTPWSDYEGGILIEEGLSEEDEQKAKEFLRRVTVLFQMKLIYFGESPLRMMGIIELNDFKGSLERAGDDWFFDKFINSGISFDGPHPHACKTPLGREEGYYKIVKKENREEIVSCDAYELIGTTTEFMKFQKEDRWFEQDGYLVQALWNIIPIAGNKILISTYAEQISQYHMLIQSRTFSLLKQDTENYNPAKHILNRENKDGQLFSIKKDIYRFSDRIIIEIINLTSDVIQNSWYINKLDINEKAKQNIYLALSISTELRLRTYISNNSQRENLSVLTYYELELKEENNFKVLDKVFYLKDIRLLHRYYYTIVPLINIIVDSYTQEQIRRALNLMTFFDNNLLIKGLVYKRSVQYYSAIRVLEAIDADHESPKINDYIKLTLAGLYQEIGKYERAYEIYKKLLDKEMSDQRNDHKIAFLLSSIGNIFHLLGKYREALEYQKQSLEIGKQIYKEHSSFIAEALGSIGATMQSLGKYKEALECQKQSIKIKKQIYKGDHLNIAVCLRNISATLQSLGILEEALKFSKLSLEMNKRIYKGTHSEVIISLNNIGNILASLDKYEEALKYNVESLEMSKLIYEDVHTDLVLSLNSMGNTLQSLGKYEEALEYYIEALKMNKQIYKDDHPDIIGSLNNIGLMLQSLGQYEDALDYLKQSLEMSKRIYKGNHLDLVSSLNNTGNIFQSLGKYEEALEYHIEALERSKQIYKNDHPELAASLNNISNILRLLGQYEEALKYSKQSIEMFRRIYKEDHSELAISLNNMGNILELLSKYKKALKYYIKSLEMNKRIFKEDNSEMAASLNNISNILRLLGQYEKALEYSKQSIEMFRRIYKEDHPDTAGALNNIGNVFQCLDKYEEALKYYIESLEMITKFYSDNDPYINQFKFNTFVCKLLFANQLMLENSRVQAGLIYKEIGIKSDHLPSIARSFLEQQNIRLAISCYEVAEKILHTKSISIKHNLACCYHIVAIDKQSRNKHKEFIEYLEKARNMFEKALILEGTTAGFYTEYAMFLVKYHDIGNINEYKKIQFLLQKSIELDDGSGLGYSKVEKLTTVKPMQELLAKQDEVEVKPYVLAHYLLVRLYTIYGKREEAKIALAKFKTITISFDEWQDEYKLAKYLYDYASKDIQKRDKAAFTIQKSWRKYIENERTKKQISQSISVC